ncbi:carbohydrate kinase family protein [Niallia taxi]|uniref:carbohydrate kinase family protein n=1 Tax=Niallia taxi TaxID=2499688 RepID=UPI003D2CF7AE
MNRTEGMRMTLENQGAISVGDAFIDYLSIDENNDKYDKRLGGASVNAAVHLSRYKMESYYVTKLGYSQDSQFVKEELTKEFVKLNYSVHTQAKKLPCVYIHLDRNGDRNFHAYMNETPDDVLTIEDIQEDAFVNRQLFYFGSGTLFHEKAREATVKALEAAKKHGAFISFDANIRLKRWETDEDCRSTIMSLLLNADIIKLSEEELLFLMEETSLEAALEKATKIPVPLIYVTVGKEGAYVIFQGQTEFISGKVVDAIDTTGAGDAYMAAVLYCIHMYGFPATIKEAVDYGYNGNIMGALVATKAGSLPDIGNYCRIVDELFIKPDKMKTVKTSFK